MRCRGATTDTPLGGFARQLAGNGRCPLSPVSLRSSLNLVVPSCQFGLTKYSGKTERLQLVWLPASAALTAAPVQAAEDIPNAVMNTGVDGGTIEVSQLDEVVRKLIEAEGTSLPEDVIDSFIDSAQGMPIDEVTPAIDDAVSSFVKGVQSGGEWLKAALQLAGQVVQNTQQAFKSVEPSLKQAQEIASPLVSQGLQSAQELASPAIKALEPQVQGASRSAEQLLRSTGIDLQAVESSSRTVLKGADEAVDFSKSLLQSLLTFLAATEPVTLLEYGAAVTLGLYLLPPTVRLLISTSRGYSGNLSAAAALDLVCNDASALLLDIRTTKEKEAAGVPDLPVRERLIDLDYAIIQDKKIRGQLRNPDAVEAQMTAMQVSALKRASKKSTMVLLDKEGGGAKEVAKLLAASGFPRCYVVTGGFDGRAGWVSSKLPIKFAASYGSAEVLPPLFGVLKTQKIPSSSGRPAKALPSGN